MIDLTVYRTKSGTVCYLYRCGGNVTKGRLRGRGVAWCGKVCIAVVCLLPAKTTNMCSIRSLECIGLHQKYNIEKSVGYKRT